MSAQDFDATNCEGMHRRSCLQLGLGALLGGGFASALQMRAQAADPGAATSTAHTRCILVWLDGGPTHYETFDPKPDAPKEIRGEYESIPTKTPGVHFSKHMKRLAAIQDRLAIVRSIRHNQGNHGAGNHYMMTGAPPRIPVACGAFVSFHPSIGSAVAYERSRLPAEELGTLPGMPPYFSIPRMSRSGGPNFLGARHAPFIVSDNPNSSGFRVRDVALPRGLSGEQFGTRRELLRDVDTLARIAERAAGDPANGLDEYYRQGYELVSSSEAQKAFDIHREPPQVRDAYGRNSFGQRVLLARRLIEAGVPFVTLYEGGWDHHEKIFERLNSRLPSVDATLAALVRDLEQRGLLDSTLVVVLGEFGRTPKINKRAGRDHWSNAMSVMFAGCGCPGGLVVGSTDKQGYSASERILSPENFASTIYRKLGLDPHKVYYTAEGRPVHLVSDPEPIRELMS